MADNTEVSLQPLKIMLSHVFEKMSLSGSKENTQSTESKTVSTSTEEEHSECESVKKIQGSNSVLLNRILNIDDPTLIVNVGVFSFQVNMEVLEMYSDYMRSNNELKEITLPEDIVSPLAFVAIYEWVLSDNPRLPRKGVVELYKAASYLRMPQLLAQFWECLSNPLIIEDTAYVMYLEALAFEVPEIRKTMLNRISRFFLPIVSYEEFLHLPVEDVTILLKSNLTAVNSEIEIFYACVRYFNFDWEERRSHLVPAMKNIRFDFLPTNFVLGLLNEGSHVVMEEVSRLVEHPELQIIMRDLLHYHCLTAYPGPKTVSIEKSCDRFWIYDTKCSYHTCEMPRNTNAPYILYLEFLAYLSFLSLENINYWQGFKEINEEKELGIKSIK